MASSRWPLNGGSLIVGGDFTKAGSVAVNSIAVWSGSAWSALDGAKSGVTIGAGTGQEGQVDSRCSCPVRRSTPAATSTISSPAA